MFRKVAALVVGGLLAASVYGAAATISDVSTGVAATGQGDVVACGNITGSTYLLYGTGISGQTATVEIDTPSDITRVTRVNIETDPSCVQNNLYVQLKTGPSGSLLDCIGFCQVTASGGLGYNETDATDNVAGCTVDLSTPVNVSDIFTLVVTET